MYEFISKELGVITLFKDGAHTTYLKTNTLSFKSPNPENWPYHWPNFLTDYKLLYETLPKIDCGELLWEKTGIYCDTTKTDHLLSRTVEQIKEYKIKDVSASTIKAFKKLEDKSQRIILVDKHGNDLIFYLSLLNEKWYLTIIDRATSDCSG